MPDGLPRRGGGGRLDREIRETERKTRNESAKTRKGRRETKARNREREGAKRVGRLMLCPAAAAGTTGITRSRRRGACSDGASALAAAGFGGSKGAAAPLAGSARGRARSQDHTPCRWYGHGAAPQAALAARGHPLSLAGSARGRARSHFRPLRRWYVPVESSARRQRLVDTAAGAGGASSRLLCPHPAHCIDT